MVQPVCWHRVYKPSYHGSDPPSGGKDVSFQKTRPLQSCTRVKIEEYLAKDTVFLTKIQRSTISEKMRFLVQGATYRTD